MITVSRLDGSELFVNSDMVEFIESTPDTIVTLSDGKKIIVQQTPEELVEAIIAFRQRVMSPPKTETTE